MGILPYKQHFHSLFCSPCSSCPSPILIPIYLGQKDSKVATMIPATSKSVHLCVSHFPQV